MEIRINRIIGVGAITAAAIASAASAGGPIAWASSVDGDWHLASNWSPASVPGISDSVLLGLSGGYTVSVVFNQSAASIAITNPSAVLDVLGFRTLTVSGPFTNAGLVRVNPLGTGASTGIQFGASGTLSGPGVLTLSNNGSLAFLGTAGGAVLTHGADHTIDGRGRITAEMINHGTISANFPGGTMELSGSDKANNSVIEAVDGAVLSITGMSITQGVNGLLVADGAGSAINFGNNTIIGGTVQGVNGGTATVFSNNSTMSGVRTLGSVRVGAFRTLNIDNALTNDGTLTINPDQVGAGTGMNFTDSSSLTGSGTVVLAASGSLSDVRSDAGQVFTHTAGHTIRGRGRITAGMVNNGTITADISGLPMELSGAAKTNNTTIQSTGGGILNIIGTNITQGASGIILATGTDSEVNIGNSTIVGGQVRGNSPARAAVTLDSTFDAVRTTGTTEVHAFRTLSIVNGLTNDGVMTINPTSTGASTGIRFEDSSVLSGVGSIVLGATGTLADVRTATGQTVTQAPAHTIEGTGRITASLVNNGTISANVPGGSLEMSAEPKTNNATIRAINTGTAIIRTDIDQNGPARITADGAGSTVNIWGATISGGVVEGINGGVVTISNADAGFDAVRFEGACDIAEFRTLNITGGLTNNGLIRVNPGAVGAGTGLNFVDSSMLGGSGRITLSHISTLAEVRTAPDQTFTQGASHTIDGRGRISGSMVNNGTVSANSPGGTMELTGSDKTNNATMRAVDGAKLSVSAAINQGASGTIDADGAGSTVELYGTTVTGGAIRSFNGGVFTVPSAAGDPTLSGVDIRTPIEVFGFRALRIGAGCSNNAHIIVNPAQVGAGTALRFDGDHTLGGVGTVTLAHTNNLAALSGDAGVTLATLGQGQRLEGIGRVAVPLEMRGTLAPGMSVGTLNATQAITMTPTATFEAEVSLPETADKVASSSAFVADGTLDVRFVDGFNPTAYWGATIVTAAQGVTGRFDTILAPVPADTRLAVRARYLPNEIRIGAVCKPDMNFDGQLNFFDISTFVSLYNIQDPDADVSAPFGVWNFFDIAAYIAQFNQGCP